jgi:hypothetical protein
VGSQIDLKLQHEGNMKIILSALALAVLASAAHAQDPDSSKWMCRNLSESGGFLYGGETVFGNQACRPIQQSVPAAAKQNATTIPAAPVATSAPPEVSSVAADSTAAPSSVGAPSKAFLLEDGTPVHLILSQNLSSADAVTGQTVEFEVIDDVIVNGLLVIPHGSTAWATVTDAEHKKRMGRAGKLDLNIDKVRLADGERALLRAVKETKGGGHQGAMVGAMVATSLVVWPAAPLFLMMHGKDVTLPKGTNISAFIQGNLTLDAAKFQRQPVVGN